MSVTAEHTGNVFSINPEKSAWRVVDGEAVLIHAETTYYYGLNASGTWIWQQLLEDDLSAEVLADRLAEQGGASTAAEIAAFLRELESEDLIETTNDSATTEDRSARSLDQEWVAPEMTRYSTLEDLIVCGE